MRPDRAIVQKAIRDAAGNLSRAAAILGCSRQTLYTWVYQLGLEKLAGIRLDTRDALDRRECKDTSPNKSKNSVSQLSNPPSAVGSNMRLVEASMVARDELPVQATMKVPESLWRRVKIEAIREGLTVSEYVRRVLDAKLASNEAIPVPRKARNGREKGEAE